MSHDAAVPATRPGTLQVASASLPLAQVLGAEAKIESSPARSAFLLLTGMLFPIAAMVVFTCLDGAAMWGLGLALAAGPLIASLAGLLWAKPWAVVVETPECYRSIHRTPSRDEAEKLVAEIRTAIA